MTHRIRGRGRGQEGARLGRDKFIKTDLGPESSNREKTKRKDKMKREGPLLAHSKLHPSPWSSGSSIQKEHHFHKEHINIMTQT